MCTRLQLPDVKKLRDALELTYDELAFTSIQKVGRLPAAHELMRAQCTPVLRAARASKAKRQQLLLLLFAAHSPVALTVRTLFRG